MTGFTPNHDDIFVIRSALRVDTTDREHLPVLIAVGRHRRTSDKLAVLEDFAGVHRRTLVMGKIHEVIVLAFLEEGCVHTNDVICIEFEGDAYSFEAEQPPLQARRALGTGDRI